MEQAYCTAVFWRGGEKIDRMGESRMRYGAYL